MISKFFIVLLFFILSCSVSKTEKMKDICATEMIGKTFKNVSFKELKNTPENFIDTIIEITGVLHFNFEDVALYMNKTSYRDNALWLELNKEMAKHAEELTKFNGKKVKVLGIFVLEKKGHLNSYYASLFNVSCIKVQ